MPDYTPAGGSPAALTFTAGAAISGGQLVALSVADTVVPAAAAAGDIGVAGSDAVAGERLTVLCGAGVLHETPSAAAIPVGTQVGPGAGGLLAAGTLGLAVRASDPAATPPVPCRWLAYR